MAENSKHPILVVDRAGRHTRAGSEVRVYAPGTRTVLGGRLVDTGGGYCSQSVIPVHLGLPSLAKSRGIMGSSRRTREDFTAREKR